MLRKDGGLNLAFINPAVPPMALWGYRWRIGTALPHGFPEVSLRPAIIVGWVSSLAAPTCETGARFGNNCGITEFFGRPKPLGLPRRP
jgi:hypothetical protein